jgi:hypothetical protein
MRGVLRSFSSLSQASVKLPSLEASSERPGLVEEAVDLVAALSNVASDVSVEQENEPRQFGHEQHDQTLPVYADQRALEQPLPDDDDSDL